jgi:hypothetical protein
MKPDKILSRARDTGLAAILILLLVTYFKNITFLILPSIILLLIIMVWPIAFKPLAPLWFGLSDVLGNVVSRVFFSLIFFFLATPVGLLRRLLGADAMKLKQWKLNSDSVFTTRDHTYEKNDLEKPF